MSSFTIDLSGDVLARLEEIRRSLESAGGTFRGDERSGAFTGATPLGEVTGAYRVEGRAVIIRIDRKPAFLTHGKIEKELRRYFGERLP